QRTGRPSRGRRGSDERPRPLPGRDGRRAGCAPRGRRADRGERLGPPGARPGRDVPRRGVPRARHRGRPDVTKALLVCRRDLAAMCRGPLAPLLGAVFLLLTGYFFYSDLALFVLVGGADATRGLWRFVFLDVRLVVLLVVPLITMRLIAEERRLGTLELAFT